MKNYTITVNGTVYEVSVEEGGAGSAPVRAAAPKAAPKAARQQLRLQQHRQQVLVPSK